MKVVCLIILALMLISIVSASNSEKITVSVFVKAKPLETQTNPVNNYLNFPYNNYKILINTIVNLINR